MIDTAGWPTPQEGWPSWLFDAPYVAAAHPQERPHRPLAEGANCQRYAYSVLALFGIRVPDHRSSELWSDPAFDHPAVAVAADLDLALFNRDASSVHGSHVAVFLGGRLLHLRAEIGRPAVWGWREFAVRERYRTIIGLVRARPADTLVLPVRHGPDASDMSVAREQT